MISANVVFFFVISIVFVMGVRIRGILFSIPFFITFSLIILSVDPRTDKKELDNSIVVQEDGEGNLFFKHERGRHFIHQDNYLHSWGCIEAGDSIHVYKTKYYRYRSLEFSRSQSFMLAKEE